MTDQRPGITGQDAVEPTTAPGRGDAPVPAPAGGGRSRSRWLHGRRPVIAAITVAALAGGWALSGTAAAQAASDSAGAVSATLERSTSSGDDTLAGITSTLGRVTGGGARSSAPKNTAPKDAAFQRDLDALVTKDGFPGVEAFVRAEDGTVRNYTAGVGDIATKAPVPVDGQVRIASNTKTFTAVTVLKLVAEGKIDLDASVETYLPGVLRGQGVDGHDITVRQLLQQTSGLPDYDTVLADKGLLPIAHTYYEPRQELDAAMTQPPTNAPGEGWAYSNTNYLVAGLVVERVTGRPIGEEITREVIRPARLEHTYWPDTGVQSIRGRHPHGYFISAPGAEPVDVTSLDPSLGWAAGQLISTPSDLSAFDRALLDGKLLEPAQQQDLLSTVAAPGFEPGSEWSYGLGFAQRSLRCGVDAWGHGGALTGYETRNLTTRDGRSAVIAVSALPTSVEGVEHVNDAVENAICG